MVGIGEIVFAGLIVAGAVFLICRSLLKGRGHCPGCDQCQMESRVEERVGE